MSRPVPALPRLASTALVISLLGSLPAAPAPLQAQGPQLLHACYVPLTGSVYRIKTPDTKPTCSSTSHIEFSWTDGMNALRSGDAAGGDLSGTYPDPSVVGLRGRALSSTAPTSGQVLTFNGSAWTPAAPPSGGGSVSDHGALGGLADDDHPQYLLGDGVRNYTNGFAVEGTLFSGSIPATGAGVRLLWYPGKAAFRAGVVFGTHWDNANVGTRSAALGENTTASGFASTALGGSTTASGGNSTAMGGGTTASGFVSTAMGGGTTASGSFSTAMGNNTIASGDRSTVMGSSASSNGQAGSFVYGDASAGPIATATAANQFVVRAVGGFRFRTSVGLGTGCDLPAGSGTFICTSSRSAKEDFADLEGEEVLEKIARMPIQTWRYRTEAGVRHLGPTAQDFHAAFGLGTDEETISLVDADGVNLLAVQALEKRTRELQAENAGLQAENKGLKQRLERVETLLQQMRRN